MAERWRLERSVVRNAIVRQYLNGRKREYGCVVGVAVLMDESRSS